MSSQLNQPQAHSNLSERTSTIPAPLWEASIPSSERRPGQNRSAPTYPKNHQIAASGPHLFQISERFGAALILSSVLVFCAAPLIAHGSAIQSQVAIVFGAALLVVAGVVQWRERKAALQALIAYGLLLGLSERTARSEARAILRKWLS